MEFAYLGALVLLDNLDIVLVLAGSGICWGGVNFGVEKGCLSLT